MNEHKGLIGLGASVGGAVVAWLPVIDTAVRIGAGVAAIVASLYMARYYAKKTKD